MIYSLRKQFRNPRVAISIVFEVPISHFPRKISRQPAEKKKPEDTSRIFRPQLTY